MSERETQHAAGMYKGCLSDHDASTAGATGEWHELLTPDGETLATLDQDMRADDPDYEWVPEEVRANARELARRWNAFEPGGVVADLIAACEITEAADAECAALSRATPDGTKINHVLAANIEQQCERASRLRRAALAKTRGESNGDGLR